MIVTSIVRGLQLIFCIIVIALSITAIKWQVYGHAPAASGYNAFAGAWGILTAIVGLAALFVSAIPSIAMIFIDALTFLILLAGGLAYAVQMRGVSCGAYDDATNNNPINYALLNGGSYVDSDNNFYPGVPFSSEDSPEYYVLQGRCTKVLADDAFLFLACLAALTATILAFIAHRRGGGTRHSAV